LSEQNLKIPFKIRENKSVVLFLFQMSEEELGAESSSTFQSTLEHALKTLLDDIGVSRKVHGS
jgi:hypothetical protein